MAVHGRLDTMSVPELLQWIALGRKTGTLVLKTPRGSAQLAFDSGTLIFSTSPDPEQTLGQLLIKRGLVSEETHERARKIRNEHSIAVAKVLTDLNVLPQAELERVLKLKAEDEIFSIFLCEEGEFTFEPKDLPALELLPLRVDVTKTMIKVSQRLDEGENYDFDASWTRKPS